MFKAYVATILALLALLLAGMVTPWLVNTDSLLTLVLVPFIWITFFCAARAVGRRVFKAKATSTTPEEPKQ